MSNNANDIKINIWINDERLAALQEANMAHFPEEAFAGMKLLAISTTPEQKDRILQNWTSAKYDSSTTGSIELLPKSVKDRLLQLSIEMRATGAEVTDRFLREA